MKQCYDESYNPRKSTLDLIRAMDGICEAYLSDSYNITVRQLYYQLVTKNLVVNTMKSYKRVQKTCLNARMAGMLDWEVFEDRTRTIITWQHFKNKQEALNHAADTYDEDMWANQDRRVFILAEKDAVAGILQPVCGGLDVPFLSNRGFCSATTMRQLGLRNVDEPAVVIYFGDHDASGLAMDEDIKSRLDTFSGNNMEVHRVALTMEQVETYHLPPNPAKMTDSRAAAYVREYGNHSWELDALTPDVMVELLKENVEQYIDMDIWDEDKARIEEVKEEMRGEA